MGNSHSGERSGTELHRSSQGIASWRAVGAEILLSYYLSLHAESCGRDGDTETGIKVLSEAFSLAARTGDRWWNAELHRLTGELLLQQKSKNQEEKRTKLKGKARQLQSISRVNKSQSEGCLQRALDVACAKKRSRWNYGQLSAWRGCGKNKGESKRLSDW